MATSLAQLVSFYKQVYQSVDKHECEERKKMFSVDKITFLKGNADNLVEELKADLSNASFFLLGQALSEDEAANLI